MLFSAPKKSGKTALAAMIAIYTAVVLGGPYAEVYCLANDYEQAASRVFQAAARIIETSPLLAGSAKITANKIEFTSTGSFIQSCASDYSGFAGANPSLTICDALGLVADDRDAG
jgi:phage terminase large subunit-like protein